MICESFLTERNMKNTIIYHILPSATVFLMCWAMESIGFAWNAFIWKTLLNCAASAASILARFERSKCFGAVLFNDVCFLVLVAESSFNACINSSITIGVPEDFFFFRSAFLCFFLPSLARVSGMPSSTKDVTHKQQQSVKKKEERSLKDKKGRNELFMKASRWSLCFSFNASFSASFPLGSVGFFDASSVSMASLELAVEASDKTDGMKTGNERGTSSSSTFDLVLLCLLWIFGIFIFTLRTHTHNTTQVSKTNKQTNKLSTINHSKKKNKKIKK